MSNEYFLQVEGMTCSSCVNKIKESLLKELNLKNVEIDLVLERARVLSHDQKISLQQILDCINRNPKFNAKFLSESNDKELYFALKGVNRQKTLNEITSLLNKKVYTKLCQGDASTATLKIEVRYKNLIDLKNIVMDIKLAVQNVSNKQVIAQPIFNDLLKEAEDDATKTYFIKAAFNGFFSIILIVANSLGWIIAPLTPIGQLIGAVVGMATLGIMAYTGKEYYLDAIKEAFLNKSVNMNTLITLGTGSAWLLSMLMVATPWIFPAAMLHYHFLPINMILGFLNIGRGFRAKAQKQAKGRMQSLLGVFLSMQPQFARKLLNHYVPGVAPQSKQISYAELKEGELIEVLPGERFPVDGIIINDIETKVNQDNITGEANPCLKKQGGEVSCGSLNLDKTVILKASCAGSQSSLAKIIDEVSKATQNRTSLSGTVDTIAGYFVPTIISLSGATAFGWWFFAGAEMSWMIVNGSLSVLLCACPCALALATPISMTLGIYEFLNNGILIRRASQIETLSDTESMCAVFDKTGTLTEPSVCDIALYHPRGQEKLSEQDILIWAASIEKHANHPIAKAISSKIVKNYLLECTGVQHVDQGISASVILSEAEEQKKEIILGSRILLTSKRITIPKVVSSVQKSFEQEGKTCVFVAVDGKCRGIITLAHDLRDDAVNAIEDVKKLGVTPYILTGDNEQGAIILAEKLGIPAENVFADRRESIPEISKRQKILELKKRYNKIVMFGDGVNDLNALKAADVGVAVGPLTQGSAVAGIALKRLDVGKLFVGAKAIYKNIEQNLYWTLFYNVISIVCAMGLLYPFFGFSLNPIFASLGMALSSVGVVMNALRTPDAIHYNFKKLGGYNDAEKSFFQKCWNAVNPINLIFKLQALITGEPAAVSLNNSEMTIMINDNDNTKDIPVNKSDGDGRRVRLFHAIPIALAKIARPPLLFTSNPPKVTTIEFSDGPESPEKNMSLSKSPKKAPITKG